MVPEPEQTRPTTLRGYKDGLARLLVGDEWLSLGRFGNFPNSGILQALDAHAEVVAVESRLNCECFQQNCSDPKAPRNVERSGYDELAPFSTLTLASI
jgi:hypothetical protein